MNIVIGIPAYNEEKNIAKLILELKKICKKIIVCDDGSTDMTASIAENFGVIVIKHQKNLGYGAAIHSLFHKAKELDYDILVTFDADGQHRIEDIKKVIEPIEKDDADIVIGSRFLDSNDLVPHYRKFGIKIITKVTNTTVKEKLTDSQSGFRAYNRKVLQELTLSEKGMGVSTEILIKASSKGLRIAEAPITILYGEDTSSQNPLPHGVSVLLATMKFTAIQHPLKFYGIPGAILSLIGLFFVIWTIQYFTEFGNFPPVLALISIGTTMVGIVLTMSAIILYSMVNIVNEKR